MKNIIFILFSFIFLFSCTSYDKSKISLSSIINILNKHNIVFLEMSTYESNLENVFTKLISSNGNN